MDGRMIVAVQHAYKGALGAVFVRGVVSRPSRKDAVWVVGEVYIVRVREMELIVGRQWSGTLFL